jgi:NADPH:quinone reductase-like Zn-dependent oxidoreductase
MITNHANYVLHVIISRSIYTSPPIARYLFQLIYLKAVNMSNTQVTTRRAFRRTDDYTPGTPKLKLVQEALPLPLAPTSVLVKVYAVAINYRDANIANGGNPWPVLPNGILCNDAAGEIIAVGEKVKALAIGDRVGPITDTDNISGREVGRSWLAADEDGVMADHIIFDEAVLCKLPDYLDWTSAATIPCAGVTAWSALKGMSIGQTVLIQGRFRPILDNHSKMIN